MGRDALRPFTIFIGLSAREGDPCDAIRDIELREACPDGERETTPLFADEDGSPLTHSILDALLKAALLYACGEAAAKIYTWHSYRSGLATALHAAGVPDAVPIDNTTENGRNATGAKKNPGRVASALWPQYACKEFGGAGWAATVLRCSKHTAIVRFTIATTRDGRPYEDARVPLNQLRPLPSRQLTA